MYTPEPKKKKKKKTNPIWVDLQVYEGKIGDIVGMGQTVGGLEHASLQRPLS